MKPTSMNFLEKSGTYFMGILYIEGIMKDLIILKKNPKFVLELNKNIVSPELVNEREKYAKRIFSNDLVEIFLQEFEFDLEIWNKPFQIIRISRNIFGHSRISANQQRLWHTPDDKKPKGFESRLAEIKYYFGIEGDGNNITIDDSNFHFEEKITMIESLDKEFFPSLAKSIGLDYERIR